MDFDSRNFLWEVTSIEMLNLRVRNLKDNLHMLGLYLVT